ncbi:MAG: hypothetical protein KJ749_03515 [Planctomycetes bacterium]|nr:hypothetical protein [Planctomycetota bacterium]
MSVQAYLGLSVAVTIAVAGAAVAGRRGQSLSEAVPYIGFACALLSLGCSGWTAWVARGVAAESGTRSTHTRGQQFGYVLAVVAGTAVLVVSAAVLSIRVAHVALELAYISPASSVSGFGYGPHGLLSLVVTLASGAVLVSTRDSRLAAGVYAAAVLLAAWACLLFPMFRVLTTGGVSQTGALLAMLVCLATILAAAATISRVVDRRRGMTLANLNTRSDSVPSRIALRVCGGVTAVAVILLVGYQLAVPMALARGGFRVAALGVAGSSAVAALGCFLFTAQFWSARFTDAGMALSSLALCAGSLSLLPGRPEALTERYPIIFNTMMVALALAVAAWTWLAISWGQQLPEGSLSTTAERMIPHAKRFAFVNAVLALTLGGLMALWPRMRSVAITDDSIGRVAAGFGANLFLLLVMLWCARRLKRLTYHILAMFVLVSTVGFMIMRIHPFTLRFG